MPRKGPAPRRELIADPIYKSVLVTQLINKVMLHGKRTVAEKIVYDAMGIIQGKLDADEEAIDTLKRAVDNVKPPLEVRSRRVGGATYQVPVEVTSRRQQSLAFRWILEVARKSRRGRPFAKSLADELMAGCRREGGAYTKRENVHKMAEANKAFSHFAW